MPAGESPFWRETLDIQNGRSRREVFDASLRTRYKEMYEDTLRSYHE